MSSMADGRARWIAGLGVGGIAIMGVTGVLHAAGAAPGAFDLDGEYTVPAFFSGALLVLASAMALALARREGGVERSLLILLAAAFGFLALDEMFSIHERLDIRTGVDWQVLYVPLGVGFVWAVWRVTGSLGRRSAEASMIFVGLGAWAVAQMLEAAAYSEVTPSLIDKSMSPGKIDDITHSLPYYAMAIPEELLEMSGSLLLAVALAAALRRVARPSH
jgi:hypothetical protein